MKRKSILALILAALVILSLSFVGCGNRYRTGNNGTTGNNAGGMDGTGFTRDTAQNDGSTTNDNSTNRNATTGEITDRTGTGGTGVSGTATDGMGANGQNNINNGTGGTSDGTGTQGRTGNNANYSDATRDRLKATADSIRYSAGNFADDFRNAGYNLTESNNTKKNYFKGNETDYLLGGDVVRLYEYGSPAELEGDINRIAPDGMTINGTDANYTRKPYYYRKGNTLIMYEGNEPAYIDEFRNNYGNAIVH